MAVREENIKVQARDEAGSPIMARVGRWPLGRAWQRLIRNVAFDFVPGGPAGRPQGLGGWQMGISSDSKNKLLSKSAT